MHHKYSVYLITSKSYRSTKLAAPMNDQVTVI